MTPISRMPDFTLNEAAISDHEIVTAWISAGFTREEAFTLLRDLKRETSEDRRLHSHCGPEDPCQTS